MRGHYNANCHRLVVLSLVLGASGLARVSAQEVLRAYGPEGPAPAMQEAAMVFGRENNVTVEIVAGPVDEWVAEARDKADLLFASANFMMTDFVHGRGLPIDSASITPLYMRPSAILVRPNNPKQIQDFPDLLKPGVRVMVVNGSGQVGLWEDMAGQLETIDALRTLRENIVFFAPHSGAAVQAWNGRSDIDAWITWNVWYMPLRDKAKLLHVSPRYVVYRQSLIARTHRGTNQLLAARFIEFLKSPEGQEIFESWGWMVPQADASPLKINHYISVVCRIDSDTRKGDVGAGLVCVKRLLEDYKGIGVPTDELRISAVVHAAAAYWLLADDAYQAFTGKAGPNPNAEIVRELIEAGVSIELCAQTMKEHDWSHDDVLPGVRIVAGAYPRIVDLELRGYAYIRF